MSNSEYAELLADEIQAIAYLADMENYALLYMNRFGMDIFGQASHEAYRGQKCYAVLQGLDAPCPFCTNRQLFETGAVYWKHYNKHAGRHFAIWDKKIAAKAGRSLRLEIAYDITEQEIEIEKLHERLTGEATLAECLRLLAEETDMETAVERLLETIGRYYGGKRAYIYEVDFESDMLRKTYEWRACGIAGRAPYLGGFFGIWLQSPNKSKQIFYRNSESAEKNGNIGRILRVKGVGSLVAAPLEELGQIVGFIGVDEPALFERRESDGDMGLIYTVSKMIAGDMQKRKTALRLERMGYVDMLTGLFNRNKYIARIQELERAPSKCAGIVYVDINGLKTINDTCGHEYGDHLIQDVANMIRGVFPDQAFRVGGDEFIVICTDIPEAAFEEKVGQMRQKSQLRRDFSVSIGAVWDRGTRDITLLIRDADNLMYAEKQSYHKGALYGAQDSRNQLVRQLLQDIVQEKFMVYLQPKVALSGGRTCGAEALVRRKKTDGEPVLPDQFLPLLEAGNALPYLDFYVTEVVCATLERWKAEGYDPVGIAVNLSKTTLLAPDAVERILETCLKHSVQPRQICIEITGNVAPVEMEELVRIAERLAGAGFSVALNDYGAQNLNLSILTEIDLGELKLDKKLIAGFAENDKAGALVEHIVGLCGELNQLPVTAVGVETREQLERLKGLGVQYAQGFTFSKALTIVEFERTFLKKW